MGSTQAVAEEAAPAQSFEDGVESFVDESKGQSPVEGHIMNPNAELSQLKSLNPGEPEPVVARKRKSFVRSLEDFNSHMQDAGKLAKAGRDPNAKPKRMFASRFDRSTVNFHK